MKGRGKFLFYVITFLSSIFLLTSSAFAEYPFLPWLDFTADFKYLDGSGGGPSQKPYYSLVFSNWNITGGNYSDGSYFGEESDPITSAVISIGTLYNSGYPDNLYFDSTTGSSGGPVSFTISDGTTTYLSATLNNFLVTDNLFGTNLNPLWDHTVASLTGITFNATGSQYIEELQDSYNTYGYINLSWNFTFYSGSSGDGFAFTDDATGTIGGKMAVTPEPVSSILFITGGATLAFRQYLKKRKKIAL